MTDGRLVGAVLVLAIVAVYAYVLVPLLLAYRRVHREWESLTAQVEAARADFEDVRAAERESLIEDVAREEIAAFVAAWEEGIIR